MKPLLAILCMGLCACVNQIDYMVRNHPKKGDQHFYMFTGWGGQHAAESSAGTRYTGNLENSFQVAAQAIVARGASIDATKVALEREVTRRVELGEITKQMGLTLNAEIAKITTEADLQKFLAALKST